MALVGTGKLGTRLSHKSPCCNVKSNTRSRSRGTAESIRIIGRGSLGRSKNRNGYGKNEPNKPPLWSAVERNEIDRVETLIKQGADIEQKHLGWSPLMKAAEENHTDIVKLLLNKKADIDAKNKKGRTPLSFAAAPSQNREVAISSIRELLRSGADPTQKDALGMTAFERATREKRTQALDVLNRCPWNSDRTGLVP